MDILEKIDEYRALLDEKDALAEDTKRINRQIDTVRDELAQMMIDAETPKVSRGGFSYSLSQRTRYSKASGMEEALMDCLRANGLGDIIKETVNAQTLQGAMSNLAAENDGDLPEEFQGLVNEYSFWDVSKRKSTK